MIAGYAGDEQSPAVLPDNLPADRQSQAGAGAGTPGGEVWFEGLFKHLRGHTAAVVDNNRSQPLRITIPE